MSYEVALFCSIFGRQGWDDQGRENYKGVLRGSNDDSSVMVCLWWVFVNRECLYGRKVYLLSNKRVNGRVSEIELSSNS